MGFCQIHLAWICRHPSTTEISPRSSAHLSRRNGEVSFFFSSIGWLHLFLTTIVRVLNRPFPLLSICQSCHRLARRWSTCWWRCVNFHWSRMAWFIYIGGSLRMVRMVNETSERLVSFFPGQRQPTP